MFVPDYPIQTERLHLRPLTRGDIDDLHAYLSREDVCRYIPPDPRSREQVAQRFDDPERNRSSLEHEGQVLCIGIDLRATKRIIGDLVLFWHSREHRAGEIGYVLNPDHQGHGYVTEACQSLLALAFDGLGLHRVTARIDARNTASAAVARRLGLRQEAYLRENEWFKGEWTDEIDFAILEDEWRAAAGQA